MATIKDIADRVGISRTAVSRILNHKGSFNYETIQKVEQAARDLNYATPRMNKKNLEQKQKKIAVIMPFQHSPYYSVLIDLMEQAAYDYGYNIILCSSSFNNDYKECMRMLADEEYCGVIFGSYLVELENIITIEKPVVTVGFKANDCFSSVHSDNYASGQIAARHLLSKKCKNLIYISKYAGGLAKDERWSGFESTLSKYDCKVTPYLLNTGNTQADNLEGALMKIALENPGTEGVFAESQRLAMQYIRVVSGLGERIPEDIKIIGYGNPYFTDYGFPRLTLIQENSREIARSTISCLVDEIECGSDVEKREITIPVSLCVNGTT